MSDFKIDSSDLYSESSCNSGKDKLSLAVKQFFGLDYLFPYQRLVVNNILEAAKAARINITWPCEDAAAEQKIDNGEQAAENSDIEEDCLSALQDTDGAEFGRQIVILPTGAGKSLCFQLPSMLLQGATLVIYPILSLMADQERRLQEKKFAPVILRGAQTKDEREAIFAKLKRGESRFIIANPEVLLTENMLQKLGELGIVHVVIDEAHCVSEWGLSFRPSYLEISKIIEASKAPIVTAFTATASELVLGNIDRYIFGGKGAHKIIGNPDRANIAYSTQGALLKDLAVADLIKQNEKPAIIFCSSRNGTEKLARYLRCYLKLNEIKFYHAGLSREEKTQVENWFFASIDGVLVSTCAYGMGVDKANVRTVIHRDFPPSVEAYLQESGRAGRDGKFSRAYLVWGADDNEAAIDGASSKNVARFKSDYDKKRLKDLFAYAQNISQCRRQRLLEMLDYTNESDKPESECCDVCEKRAHSDMREEKTIINFFAKNKRSYTDSESAKILEHNSDISWSEKDAKHAVNLMIKTQKLRRCKSYFWKNKITVHL
ncbi:MAG: RecQ family ATP-dependent DNA helicase [Termitinemataceae bacterium]|nr:MAG: RecQ family ATP-dependent DNA helicase [Termitinemataceae bacterium]